jgi:GDPmannose 4,6-dehydratase
MWLMLQQEKADDYVIATGEIHSVKEFLNEVFDYLDLNWKQYVKIDTNYCRPAEVDILQGDASKARKLLKWSPKISFKELAQMMTDADMKLIKEEKIFD